MKILMTAAFAASCCFVAFGSASAISASSSESNLTCRTALENSGFSETVANSLATPCCYVLEETEWYNANDVLLERFYERQDGQIYLTKQCRIDLVTGLSVGAGSGVGQASSEPAIGNSSEASGLESQTSSVPDDDSSSIPGNGSSSVPEDQSSSSSMSTSQDPGNPGNDNPVGGAGEAPNGDASGFKPDPGTKGQGN